MSLRPLRHNVDTASRGRGMSQSPQRLPLVSARRSVNRNEFNSLTRTMTSGETPRLTPLNSISRDSYNHADGDMGSST